MRRKMNVQLVIPEPEIQAAPAPVLFEVLPGVFLGGKFPLTPRPGSLPEPTAFISTGDHPSCPVSSQTASPTCLSDSRTDLTASLTRGSGGAFPS